jgi:hypothetical protein
MDWIWRLPPEEDTCVSKRLVAYAAIMLPIPPTHHVSMFNPFLDRVSFNTELVIQVPNTEHSKAIFSLVSHFTFVRYCYYAQKLRLIPS